MFLGFIRFNRLTASVLRLFIILLTGWILVFRSSSAKLTVNTGQTKRQLRAGNHLLWPETDRHAKCLERGCPAMIGHVPIYPGEITISAAELRSIYLFLLGVRAIANQLDMEVKVNIPFQELVKLIRQLSAEQKAQIQKELAKNAKPTRKNSRLTELPLKGPFFTEKQINTMEETRKSIDQWRMASS